VRDALPERGAVSAPGRMDRPRLLATRGAARLPRRAGEGASGRGGGGAGHGRRAATPLRVVPGGRRRHPGVSRRPGGGPGAPCPARHSRATHTTQEDSRMARGKRSWGWRAASGLLVFVGVGASRAWAGTLPPEASTTITLNNGSPFTVPGTFTQ